MRRSAIFPVASPTGRTRRVILGSILAIVSLVAFAGGFYGMAGARDIPIEWLKGTPFEDYFLPGLILFVMVGGSCLYASLMVFTAAYHARGASLAAAVALFFWLATQMAIAPSVWVHSLTAVAASAILLLSIRKQPPPRPVFYYSSN